MRSIRRYWPYDEVKITKDPSRPDRYLVSAPWLEFSVDVSPSHADRASAVAEKLATGDFSRQDIDNVSWFFSSLAKMPLAYVLPRAEGFGADVHRPLLRPLRSSSPREALRGLAAGAPRETLIASFADRALPMGWTWDQDAALEFSRAPNGIDPESLFSVARRFHLLNDLEWNKTGEMLSYVENLKGEPERFRKASALIVRQNHYITEMCDGVLRAALPLAQGAYEEVADFIQAEAGHDRILTKALEALGASSSTVPVIDVTVTLMDAFGFAAERNLLAFAMIVDIFERTSYEKADPMTSLLLVGGESAAGRQLDIHREINDAGEHENAALGFLHAMAPVDEAYAREALFLAELVTLVIHQVSAETLSLIKAG